MSARLGILPGRGGRREGGGLLPVTALRRGTTGRPYAAGFLGRRGQWRTALHRGCGRRPLRPSLGTSASAPSSVGPPRSTRLQHKCSQASLARSTFSLTRWNSRRKMLHQPCGSRGQSRTNRLGLAVRFKLLPRLHPHAARDGRCGSGSHPGAGRGFAWTTDGRRGPARPKPVEVRLLPRSLEPLADGRSEVVLGESQAGLHPGIAAANGQPCAGRCARGQQYVRWTGHPPPAAGCRHAVQFGHAGRAHETGDAAGFVRGMSKISVQRNA